MVGGTLATPLALLSLPPSLPVALPISPALPLSPVLSLSLPLLGSQLSSPVCPYLYFRTPARLIPPRLPLSLEIGSIGGERMVAVIV